MRNINNILSRTPFVNGTYNFYATTEKDKPPPNSYYYTPYDITGWQFKKYSQFSAKANALHEISHILDLYEREQYSRLLKPNFGWVLTNRDNSTPREWMMVEVAAVCIQNLLTKEYSTERYVDPVKDNELRKVYNSITSTPFAKDMREWRKIFKPVYESVFDKGLEHYLDIWESASAYVRENRTQTKIPA